MPFLFISRNGPHISISDRSSITTCPFAEALRRELMTESVNPLGEIDRNSINNNDDHNNNNIDRSIYINLSKSIQNAAALNTEFSIVYFLRDISTLHLTTHLIR